MLSSALRLYIMPKPEAGQRATATKTFESWPAKGCCKDCAMGQEKRCATRSTQILLTVDVRQSSWARCAGISVPVEAKPLHAHNLHPRHAPRAFGV